MNEKSEFFFFFLGRRIRESEKEKHCETIKNCTASTRKEVVVVVPGKARVSDARFFFSMIMLMMMMMMNKKKIHSSLLCAQYLVEARIRPAELVIDRIHLVLIQRWWKIGNSGVVFFSFFLITLIPFKRQSVET